MENEAEESAARNSVNNSSLIGSFCEITSSSREEAQFFLESHNWDLDAAVSTFFDGGPAAVRPINAPPSADSPPQSQSPSKSPSLLYAPSQSRSPSRSRSSSPARQSRAPYELRSRGAAGKKKAERPSGSRRRGGIRTPTDLNQKVDDGSGSDSDEPQEYYTGGEKSGMLVQDPAKGNNVDSIFDQARRSGAVERPPDNPLQASSLRSFTGTARLLSGETVASAPQPLEIVSHTITFWQNGFTVDDGPLRSLDDPVNASFLESIKNSECPRELMPADRRPSVHVDLVRREEAYKEPKKRQTPFHGTGRTIGSTAPSDAASAKPTGASSAGMTQPPPLTGPVVDNSLPSTSIQLRLLDGTRVVSHFNLTHTIRDVQSYISALMPGGPRNYQLQTMGFPPKQLTNLDQTIEEAGIANYVIIQKL